MTDRDASLTRLNKFISETGFCSRREADRYIADGRVTINGVVPEMGTKVSPGDEVLVNGKPLRAKQEAVYLAFNKPVGITCTTERHVEGNIIDYIGHPKRIFPIGRLDKPSDGLIFLTSDGDIVNKILRAGNAHEKEYIVRVDRPINTDFLKRMAAGVPILDTVTLPCRIEQISTYVFRITLTQGLNRQIRRMCEALGYEVFKLKRVRIMNISLEGLGIGQWRYLTQREMSDIQQMIEGSSGTEEASRFEAAPPPTQRAVAARQQRAAQDTDPDRRGAPQRAEGKSTGSRNASRKQAGSREQGSREQRSRETSRKDGAGHKTSEKRSGGREETLASSLKPRTRSNATGSGNDRGSAGKSSINKSTKPGNSGSKASGNGKTAANRGAPQRNTSGKGPSNNGGNGGGRGRR